MKKNKKIWSVVLAATIIVIGLGVYQIHSLNISHSTFEKYSRFRGCEQILEKTDTYGTCRLSSGQIIKIVEIQNNWYLDGDGPGIY